MEEAGAQSPLFADPLVVATPLPEPLGPGGLLLRSPAPLAKTARHIGEWLAKWAEQAPDRVFIAERAAAGAWRRVTYAEAFAAARSIGQALLDRDLSVDRPIVVLSENSVDVALLGLGAALAGVPVAPVSPAYSLVSQDFVKLRVIFEMMRPGLVYAADGRRFERALLAAPLERAEVVVSSEPPSEPLATRFGELLGTRPGPRIDAAFDRIGPDTIAKVLFTSGSTGEPKGVINTQRMLCASQQALAQVWPFLDERPPVLCDWLPWSHTFGGNHNFNLVLRAGGTLYIDGGKPAPGLIEVTAENLRDTSPTVYFNVPRGYDMLLPYLERDADLRQRFFRRLDLIHYAAAALPASLWDRLARLSTEALGRPVAMVSAWGSTETSPLATAVHYAIPGPGNIGLPVPGTDIKMVPASGKLELRVRGPNVTPGYWKRPDLTAAAFDDEGFFCMGDAGKLAVPGDPARGLVFDGRIAEDFKLTSGTWVHVGALRVAVISAGAPVVQDAVITGHDSDAIGALIFPNLAGCRALCPEAGLDALLEDLVQRPAVRDKIAAGLAAHNAANPASSTRVDRVLLLTEPPSIDAGEITDKGYINQRAVLTRRAALVLSLTSGSAPESIHISRWSV
jgi:feruloyl-CoA synthase